MIAYFQDSNLGGLKENQSIDELVHTIFDGLDKDSDLLVSHDEFTGPKHDEF